MRDNYSRRSTLQTMRYPTAELVVKRIEGLPWPAPASGDVSRQIIDDLTIRGVVNLQIIGDLTVHGITKETTWEATAKIVGQEVTGLATASFRFADFGNECAKRLRRTQR